jgi:hypothetical protein
MARALSLFCWDDVDLLTTVPGGVRQTACLLLSMGRYIVQWDDTLALDMSCDPGSQFWNEHKTFYTQLDNKIKDLVVNNEHHAVFPFHINAIDASIRQIHAIRFMEDDRRSEERTLDLARSFNYHLDDWADANDQDAGYGEQALTDMPEAERVLFERHFDRMERAMEDAGLGQFIFPWTEGYLWHLRGEVARRDLERMANLAEELMEEKRLLDDRELSYKRDREVGECENLEFLGNDEWSNEREDGEVTEYGEDEGVDGEGVDDEVG